MRGILSDVNIQGQMEVLLHHLDGDEWRAVWHSLNLSIYTFADCGLSASSVDSEVWRVCQENQVILITGNRNKSGPDSLEATIENHNSSVSLPVFTIGDTERVLRSGAYANQVAVRLLEYLMDIDNYRGTGRLWIP